MVFFLVTVRIGFHMATAGHFSNISNKHNERPLEFEGMASTGCAEGMCNRWLGANISTTWTPLFPVINPRVAPVDAIGFPLVKEICGGGRCDGSRRQHGIHYCYFGSMFGVCASWACGSFMSRMEIPFRSWRNFVFKLDRDKKSKMAARKRCLWCRACVGEHVWAILRKWDLFGCPASIPTVLRQKCLVPAVGQWWAKHFCWKRTTKQNVKKIQALALENVHPKAPRDPRTLHQPWPHMSLKQKLRHKYWICPRHLLC